MSAASFSASAYDKLKQLDVTKQTKIVVTDTTKEVTKYDPTKVAETVRNNPGALQSIMDRVKNDRANLPKNTLGALLEPLQFDAKCDMHSGQDAFSDRLGRSYSDRALVGALCMEELMKIAGLMQGSKYLNLVNYFGNNSISKVYNGSAKQNATVVGLVGLLKVLNPATQTTAVDVAADSSVNLQIVDSASKLGATDIITDTITNIDGPGAAVKKQSALDAAISHSFDNGDANTMAALIDTGLTTPSVIKSTNPEWATTLAGNYSLPTDATPNSYGTQLTTFNDSMNTIQGTQSGSWWSTPTGSNLNLFNNASDDAKKIMMTDSELRTPTMLASSYQPVSVKSLVKKSNSFLSFL